MSPRHSMNPLSYPDRYSALDRRGTPFFFNTRISMAWTVPSDGEWTLFLSRKTRSDQIHSAATICGGITSGMWPLLECNQGGFFSTKNASSPTPDDSPLLDNDTFNLSRRRQGSFTFTI
jgi:hypothetical protein